MYIILQSRTDSKRLPGKCFLMLCDKILTELCAQRISDGVNHVWVATSDESSDDLLAHRLFNCDLNVFRGSKDDVIKRFIDFANEQKIVENEIIVRLTADNTLVDCEFIELMLSIWNNNNLDFLSAEPQETSFSNWPKGLSVEMFRAKHLYEAGKFAVKDFDREHVTPYIKRLASKKATVSDFISLNATFLESYGIDSLENFLFVAAAFGNFKWDAPYWKILNMEKPNYDK